MKLVFFGNPKFASDSLEYLLKSKYEIDLVVTNPDKRKGRGLNHQPTAVKIVAQKFKCEIYETDNFDNSLVDKLTSINPDIAIVVAYKFLPKKIYKIPKIATINLHASILPRHSGASPIQYTLLKGDNKSGLTTFVINDKIDEGDIILQNKVLINDKTTFLELYNKLSILGGELLAKSIDMIIDDFPLIKQNPELRTYAPKIKKNDYVITWNDSAYSIHNKIRALGRAYSFIDNKRIKFFETYFTLINTKNSEPGTYFFKDKKLWINTGKGLLEVNKIQIEGKKITKVSDICNNHIFKSQKFN